MKATAHHHQSIGRHLIALAVTLAITFGVGAAPVSADELIAFSNDELLIAEPGTLTNLAEVSVAPSEVGQLCTLSVASQNQASIHNGNDLIVRSGDVETVIADVEAEADQATDLSVDIVLGPTISVDLRMGPDWVSSLGFGLWLECSTADQVLVTGQPEHCPNSPEENPSTTTDDDQTGADQPGDDHQISEGTSADCSAVVDDTDPEIEPPPLTAAPVEIPTVPPQDGPLPCPGADVGSMTVDTTDCPTPEIEGTTEPASPAAPAPSAPAAPQNPATPATPAPQPGTESEPADDTNASGAESSEPEVLGLQVERLPQTPAAPAVTATPTYNG